MENQEQVRREQHEVLGTELTRTERPLTILGLVAWRSLWSMGKGAGAAAFMRSPVCLAAAGHNIHVVQPCARGDEGVELYGGASFHKYRSPEIFSNPHKPLPIRLWNRVWRYVWFQLTAPGQMYKLAREIRPDVIVAYDVMTMPPARRVANRLGLPLVARVYGNTLSLALHRRLSWYGNFMERIGFQVPVDAMILNNDGSSTLEVLRRLKVDFTPVHYLRNGIDGDLFTPGPRPQELMERLQLPPDAFVLITVTRFHSEKRLDRTIRALAALRREVPEAYAVMVGDGAEKPAIEALARELGVADAVRMPGAVKNAELAPWYRLADVMLSLLDRTNAANPVYEAMACERCVLALDTGTTRDVVKDGETGVLIAPEREADIPRVLAELARDPQRRAALGRMARPFILDLCGSIKQRMEREITIIEEVARTRRVLPGNVVSRPQ
jgi:glycosyltransferase involved in cell wall biosynthesis